MNLIKSNYDNNVRDMITVLLTVANINEFPSTCPVDYVN